MYYELARQLQDRVAQTVERAIGLLGIAGFYPSHLAVKSSDTYLMLGDRVLAVVYIEWPAIDVARSVIRFGVAFAPPLGEARR